MVINTSSREFNPAVRKLLICWLITGSFITVLAQPKFIISDRTAFQGDEVVFDVRAIDFKEVLGFQFSLVWDPGILAYTQIDSISSLSSNYSIEAFNEEQELTDSGIILTTHINTMDAPLAILDSSLLFSVRFTVIGEPGSMTRLEISDNPLPVEVIGATPGNELMPYSFEGGHFEVNVSTNTANYGIEDYAIYVFPNPATELITVAFNDPTVVFDLKLYSLSGQLIAKQPNTKTIDLSGYADGLYILQVKIVGDDSGFSTKVMKY